MVSANSVDAQHFQVTDELEAFVTTVNFQTGTPSQSITFKNTYSSPPTVVCIGTNTSTAKYTPAVRMTPPTTTGVNLKVQKLSNIADDTSNPQVYEGPVHCIVAAQGTHSLPDGTQFQAGSVISSGLGVANANEVPIPTNGSLNGPLGALAQIMSYNDARPTVPLLNDCDSRANPPYHANTADGACVMMHAGRNASKNPARADETIGYIVFEEGSGTFSNSYGVFGYDGEVGSDKVRGIRNGPPFSYGTGYQLQIGVGTQAGEDGGDGSYPALFGTSPLAGTSIDFVVDERQGIDRGHTHEQVSWWGFGVLNIPLDIVKTVDILNTDQLDLLTYEIHVTNTGATSTDGVSVDDTLRQNGQTLPLSSGVTFVAASDTNGNGILDPGETWTYVATYQLTTESFEDGNDVVNSATVDTAQSAPEDVTATTTLTRVNALTVDKTHSFLTDGGEANVASVGDVIRYTYAVENTGNLTLSNVELSDIHDGFGDTPAPGNETLTTDASPSGDSSDVLANNGVYSSLKPGDIVTFTWDYTVTQDDIEKLQ